LAACLVFSPRILGGFIQFLLPNEQALESDALAEVEVVTQEMVDGGGFIDLLLRLEGRLLIALEVKVKSRESDEHHREQLTRYREWLNSQRVSARWYLVTLVRDVDTAFRPEECGVHARWTWRELYKHLQRTLKESGLSDTECRLIKHFCDYLEREEIVSTYETKHLFRYADGLKAREAVTGIFNQVSSRLEPDGFTTNSVVDKKNYWPQLQIQNFKWKKIFGKGDNYKISLWFCVPRIWDAERHEFQLSIELWHEEHGNQWRHTKAKLPAWVKILKGQNVGCYVHPTWGEERPLVNPASDIQFEPKGIKAYLADCEIPLDEGSPPNEDELVDSLVKQVRRHARVIDSLGIKGTAVSD
ncbi:MAG: PD-(D/E)XK nuclease family protein, partial [Verrucomicrobia bacterium]|nr:PD-(D/E)XK nuclease family protein [Verrucomicrobiota bacterium]